jgi:hypothetical protein
VVASVVVPVTVPAQLSVAVGAAVTDAEHCPVMFGKVATFATGAMLSVTTTLKLHDAVPQPLTAVKVTAVVQVLQLLMLNIALLYLAGLQG